MKIFCYLILKKNYSKKFNTKKGSSLLIVIIVMMITFMLSIFLLETSVKNNRQTEDTIDSTRAYYSAETGIYDAIYEIINNQKILYNNYGIYGDGMEVHKVKVSGSNPYTIYSIGKYGSQEYSIVVKVSINGTSYFITEKTVYKN